MYSAFKKYYIFFLTGIGQTIKFWSIAVLLLLIPGLLNEHSKQYIVELCNSVTDYRFFIFLFLVFVLAILIKEGCSRELGKKVKIATVSNDLFNQLSGAIGVFISIVMVPMLFIAFYQSNMEAVKQGVIQVLILIGALPAVIALIVAFFEKNKLLARMLLIAIGIAWVIMLIHLFNKM